MDKVTVCKQRLKLKLSQMTDYSDQYIAQIINEIPVSFAKKNAVLLQQGEKPSTDYYLLMGCVRQHAVDANGKEVTLAFYTQNQPINTAIYVDTKGLSQYSFTCLEDSYFTSCLHADISQLRRHHSELVPMIDAFYNDQVVNLQQNYFELKMRSPEQRFKAFVDHHKALLARVPQKILANYLDITPETFSRYKKLYVNKDSYD